MQEVRTVTCFRCGVDFDPTDYIKGAPCRDCQLDYPENFLRVDVAKAQEAERIASLVTRLHAERMSDGEIGEAIGMSLSAVRDRRVKLGLPAHQFKGDEKWRDPEKVRTDLRNRLTKNPIVVYRKNVRRTGLLAPNGNGFTSGGSEYD